MTARLADRLAALVRADRPAEAARLAREALRLDTVREVTVEDDVVRVETDLFRGTHPVRADPGRPAVDPNGTYSIKREDLAFSFRTSTITDEARRRAASRLRDDGSHDRGTGAGDGPSPADAGSEPAAGTALEAVGGDGPGDAAGAAAPVRADGSGSAGTLETDAGTDGSLLDSLLAAARDRFGR